MRKAVNRFPDFSNKLTKESSHITTGTVDPWSGSACVSANRENHKSRQRFL